MFKKCIAFLTFLFVSIFFSHFLFFTKCCCCCFGFAMSFDDNNNDVVVVIHSIEENKDNDDGHHHHKVWRAKSFIQDRRPRRRWRRRRWRRNSAKLSHRNGFLINKFDNLASQPQKRRQFCYHFFFIFWFLPKSGCSIFKTNFHRHQHTHTQREKQTG